MIKSLSKTLKYVIGTVFLVGTIGVMAAPITIKYAAYHSSNETFITIITDMMDNIEKRTDGEVKFEKYFSGSLLKAQDLYPGLSRGVVDMATSAPQAFNMKQFPIAGVVLPYMTRDFRVATNAFHRWTMSNDEVLEEFRKNGAHVLLGWSLPENVVWSTKAIKTAADLQGMRIRTLLGPGEALELLGATAVATPYTEAIDLMQRGGVDGISTTFFEQGVRDGIGGVAKFVSSGGEMGVFAMMLTAINNKVWEGLDGAVQEIFNEEAASATQRYFEVLVEKSSVAAKQLADKGKVKVLELDKEEADNWKKKTQDVVWKNYVERVDSSGANGQKLLNNYMTIIADEEINDDFETGLQVYQRLTD